MEKSVNFNSKTSVLDKLLHLGWSICVNRRSQSLKPALTRFYLFTFSLPLPALTRFYIYLFCLLLPGSSCNYSAWKCIKDFFQHVATNTVVVTNPFVSCLVRIHCTNHGTGKLCDAWKKSESNIWIKCQTRSLDALFSVNFLSA